MSANSLKWQKLFLLPLLILTVYAFTSCTTRNPDAQAGISISFDDQYVEEWYALRNLLNRYDAKVTFFITYADSLTEAEKQMLHTLQQDGHEIASHGTRHVNAEYFIKEHSYRKYLDEEIILNSQFLEEAGFTPTAFAYPFGAKYWFTDYLLLKHFKMLRGVAPPNKKEGLAASDAAFYKHDNSRTPAAANIDVRDGLTPEMIDEAIKRAVQQKQVLLLFGHKPAPASEAEGYSFNIDFLEYILKTAKEHELKHYRFSDLHQD